MRVKVIGFAGRLDGRFKRKRPTARYLAWRTGKIGIYELVKTVGVGGYRALPGA